MLGGIPYFYESAYDLPVENERIVAASFDAAIWAKQQDAKMRKINVLSSGMVYEFAAAFSSCEGEGHRCPPLFSTRGLQKLPGGCFVQGACEQYQLPYTVICPFNCVGTGEKRALCDRESSSGNIKLAMSHVVPDLVQKIVKGQDPLHILGNGNQIRHYTYGDDLARGIRLCIENDAAVNQDFNLSTPVSTSVLELAERIWRKIHGEEKAFRYVSDKPFLYDVQKRVPREEKAERLPGCPGETPLDSSLDEVIPWIVGQVRIGGV